MNVQDFALGFAGGFCVMALVGIFAIVSGVRSALRRGFAAGFEQGSHVEKEKQKCTQ